ncbi:hypothetical protein [Streptomyces milbemycinicus]|uniref:Uncharacterized protein n=1 Tax=Streptomyces milbemycinicus TaxID=476552 RepID=A0ABW8M3U5_9ACTN
MAEHQWFSYHESVSIFQFSLIVSRREAPEIPAQRYNFPLILPERSMTRIELPIFADAIVSLLLVELASALVPQPAATTVYREMHNLLLSHWRALRLEYPRRHAAQTGPDKERFERDCPPTQIRRRSPGTWSRQIPATWPGRRPSSSTDTDATAPTTPAACRPRYKPPQQPDDRLGSRRECKCRGWR